MSIIAALGNSLEKLTIAAYESPERTGLGKTYEVMFNPTSYAFTYKNEYSASQCPSTSANQADYRGTKARNLSLKLIIDGSSATVGIARGLPAFLQPFDTVPQQVENFLDLTTRLYGDNTGSRYLRLQWGELQFECRVASVTVNYTLFDRSGVALRAELDVSFIEDVKKHPVGSAASTRLRSLRTMSGGLTLPLMSALVYTKPIHYVELAKANRLNSLRSVKPGTLLVCPPLSKKNIQKGKALARELASKVASSVASGAGV